MARPETHLDLSDTDRRGEEIVRWNYSNIMSKPAMAKHLVSSAEAAEKLGLVVDNEGIYDKPPVDVLESRLLRAQDRWDELKNKYEVAKDFQSPSADLYYINQWARENGFPAIKPAQKEIDQF